MSDDRKMNIHQPGQSEEEKNRSKAEICFVLRYKKTEVKTLKMLLRTLFLFFKTLSQQNSTSLN